RFRPLGVPLAEDLPLAPLHWHIADGAGALVLEATREGVRLYDDPVGVLTNNPPFPLHQVNLSQYQHLTAQPHDTRQDTAHSPTAPSRWCLRPPGKGSASTTSLWSC